MLKVFFKTFGCRTNIFDTQVMISSLKNYELINNEEEADVIVVNSCTVTNGADKDVKNYLSKIQKYNKKILFTGCGLNSVGKIMYDNGRIFGAFGHSSKQDIEFLINKNERFYITNNLNHIDSKIISEFIGKSRAFIKIQEGCNFKCSYCVIPQVRGKSRSYPRKHILEQIRILADSKISEVVLSGTNLGSYGKDTNDTLAKLLIDISKINGIKRIRLGSLEPSQIKDDLIEVLDSNFMERHLHIALQHTDNTMLKSMSRINRFELDLNLFNKIANKGYALGTDFIVGFPGENEDIFNNALSNFKLLPLTHIHAFIFSKRNNTRAASFTNDIPPKNISKERLRMLKEIIANNNLLFRQKKYPLRVLVENKKEDFFYGLDQYFNKIKIKSNKNLFSNWIDIMNYEVYKDINYVEI